MNYEELQSLLKRIEFNKTEPETLTKLVSSAQRKGEKTQKELRDLRKLTDGVLNKVRYSFLFNNQDTKNSEKFAVGIDGSHQLVNSVGGKWYLFFSVTRILFRDGLDSEPEVEVFWADIDEIHEQENPNIKLTAEERMLTAESKAILNWGDKKLRSAVFIDGPIVDPPFPYGGEEDYIIYRCEGLRKCINNSHIIGCGYIFY